jgi:hypothetical protein
MAGIDVPCPALPGVKVHRPVSSAGFQIPAAGPFAGDTALKSQTEEHPMTLERPMFPPVDPTRRNSPSTTPALKIVAGTEASICAKAALIETAPAPAPSKIIEQCVVYVQQLAAYDAGFSVDRTDGSEHCNGKQIKKARGAMCKLIGLSPHKRHEAPVLTALELYAKAGVLTAMYGLRNGEEPDETETTYIRFFAGEVADFLTAHHEVPE